jgi:hypothetical protein
MASGARVAVFQLWNRRQLGAASALDGLDRLTVQDDHEGQGKRPLLEARLLMKRPLQMPVNLKLTKLKLAAKEAFE